MEKLGRIGKNREGSFTGQKGQATPHFYFVLNEVLDMKRRYNLVCIITVSIFHTVQ